MTLIDINKQVYRKHLNIIIIGFIIVFMLLALIFGQGLIAIFADGQASTAQQSNFRYNLVGVVFALIACMVILSQLREQPFFKEVYYVWQLKHNSWVKFFSKRLFAHQVTVNLRLSISIHNARIRAGGAASSTK